MALKTGALGMSISGAGPSVFAMCTDSGMAEEIGKKAQLILKQHKINSDIFLSSINLEGAFKF